MFDFIRMCDNYIIRDRNLYNLQTGYESPLSPFWPNIDDPFLPNTKHNPPTTALTITHKIQINANTNNAINNVNNDDGSVYYYYTNCIVQITEYTDIVIPFTGPDMYGALW